MPALPVCLLLVPMAVTATAESARPRPPVHSVAYINDTRSHGAVGDQWLSLAEAILLTNRELDEHSLSAAEYAQLGGFGSDIAWADAVDVVRVTCAQ